MALIQCPRCGKSISDQAEVCPGCGWQARKTGRELKPVHIAAMAIAMAAVIVLAALLITGGKGNRSDTGIPAPAAKTASSGDDSGTYSRTYSAPQYTAVPRTGNQGAVAKAKSYLNVSAFSYSGLVKQLEFEGFSNSEARYGADHCGADWNAQAVKKAKSYLNSSSFSYEGLIKQLEFEGFTSQEARYGADRCGANWNEQAVKKAKSYLRSHSGWTRSKLISQLEFEGFTYSQAVYGADHCGGF